MSKVFEKLAQYFEFERLLIRLRYKYVGMWEAVEKEATESHYYEQSGIRSDRKNAGEMCYFCCLSVLTVKS